MINKKELTKKLEKVALLGLGKDNLALLELFDKYQAPIEVTICDFRDKDKLPKLKLKNLNYKFQLGNSFNQDLDKFDILFRSPGWPIKCPGITSAKRKNKKLKVSTALNIFFELSPSQNIIGVTGTKGKGTTATLIYEILKKATNIKSNVFLGGNIGITPLSFLEKIKKDDYIVLELSSFQLEDLNYSPKFAVITNLFREHLAPADPNNPNYHSSFSSYFKAKLNIAKKATNKYLVANEKLKSKIEKEKLSGKKIYFASSQLPTKLTGDYNRENVAAAVTLAKLLKVKAHDYEKVVAQFGNLEHRLELVKEIKKVKYYNNSFSTTPESTILDLESFDETILIAGGADKGASFKDLAKRIKERVEYLILLPGAGSKKIILELNKINYPNKQIILVPDMKEAVNKAKKNAKPGSTVLLSTACASFGIFKNYKERGELFRKYVKANK